MNYQNDLQHTGVLGMKWGHRKAQPTSSIRRRYDSTKAEKKSANKEFSRDYNKARTNPLNSITKKGNEKWAKAVDSAEKANIAADKFKAVRKERSDAIKSQAKELNKQTSLGEKMWFNDATRKLAAQYVVDHNMTVAEATKKSHAVANRNTAIFLGIAGGYLISQIAK